MNNKLEIFKKRLIYRAGYRGTKEMDILLSSFVKYYVSKLNIDELKELEIFLYFDSSLLRVLIFSLLIIFVKPTVMFSFFILFALSIL